MVYYGDREEDSQRDEAHRVASMSLYEILTGGYGESYVRCYAWAASEDEARDLFRKQYAGLSDYQRSGCKSEPAKITCLFSATDTAFITPPSDSGFGNDV